MNLSARAPASSPEQGDKWMQAAVPKPRRGRLHAALGIPLGDRIPVGKIEKATHSSNPHLQKMATLAQTFAKLRGGS